MWNSTVIQDNINHPSFNNREIKGEVQDNPKGLNNSYIELQQEDIQVLYELLKNLLLYRAA